VDNSYDSYDSDNSVPYVHSTIAKLQQLVERVAWPLGLLLLSSLTLGGMDYYTAGDGGDTYYDDYPAPSEEPSAPVQIVPVDESFVVECSAAAGMEEQMELLHNGEAAATMAGVSRRPGGFLVERAMMEHSGNWRCSNHQECRQYVTPAII
jgi:hypothetical protein